MSRLCRRLVMKNFSLSDMVGYCALLYPRYRLKEISSTWSLNDISLLVVLLPVRTHSKALETFQVLQMVQLGLEIFSMAAEFMSNPGGAITGLFIGS